MFAWEKHVKIWQLVGALLAIPAGVVGTYSAYRTYMAGGVSCSDLRNSIIVELDKKIAADVKRTLLRRDVEQFTKRCGDEDPDAKVIFEAAIAPASATAEGAPKSAAGQGPIFGLSRGGERRGWVQLIRRAGEGKLIPNFDGFPIAPGSLPPVGTVLTAQFLVPVWLDAPPPGQANDASELQGRLGVGACVKVLTRGPAGRPFWAEVAPEPCKQAG
jgi:hypothetical protein